MKMVVNNFLKNLFLFPDISHTTHIVLTVPLYIRRLTNMKYGFHGQAKIHYIKASFPHTY